MVRRLEKKLMLKFNGKCFDGHCGMGAGNETGQNDKLEPQ